MKRVVGIAVAVFLIQGCNFKIENPTVKIDPNVNLGDNSTTGTDDYKDLSCSAGLPASMGGVVDSGAAAPIVIQAIDGVGPYKVYNQPGTFNAQATITRTYTNTTTTNEVVTDTVQILDAKGHSAQCQFTVTVKPVGNPSTLACTLVASPASPQVNQSTTFTVTGNGGTAPYVFNQLSLGTGGTISSPLTQISATQASAVGSYSSTGLRTASVQVRDATNTPVSCSQSVNVLNVATVAVSTSPSANVSYTQPITLTATGNDFPSAPTFSFAFATTQDGTGLTLSATGNTAVVTVVDGLNHPSVNVVATATGGGVTATKTTTLSFTGSLPLTCIISNPSGPFSVNQDIPFTVTSNTGEPLTITDFNVGTSGTITGSTANSRTVAYSTSGTKTIGLRANSTTRPTVSCNNGALLQQSVVVQSLFSCDAYTYYNPSYTNEYFKAYAVPTGGIGTVWLETIKARNQNNGAWFVALVYGWPDALSAYLNFPLAATYSIELTVRDSTSRTAKCTTTHIVKNYW